MGLLIFVNILFPFLVLFASEDLFQKSEQMILVLQDVEKKKTTLQLYEIVEGQWREKGSPILAAVGRNGLFSASEKKEGDGATPKGEYPLLRAYGYRSLSRIHFPYEVNTPNHYWVDDSSSELYNRRVKGKPKAKSYHSLLRKDNLYKYMIVIEYNTDPAEEGKGSMIFIHPWADASKPTSGCLGISEEKLKEILLWLKKDKNPSLWIESYSEVK